MSSGTLNIDAPPDSPLASQSPGASSGSAPRRYASTAKWLARAAIVGAASALAWYTWGHWGDFQIDCGREIYAPVELLKGKLLYRDLWYCYGPLAPYLQALLFRIFGIHLAVLYWLGFSLTLGSAFLTFEVARRFPLPVAAATTPSLIFLVEAFHPSIFNFIFPYSYAASLGSFLGVACLYMVIRHAGGGRRWHLGLAALLAGLAALTKQEFGIACIALLCSEMAALHLSHRIGRDTIKNALACVAGLLPAAATYAWFIAKLSAKAIFIDNWMSTPGTYFMRTFGRHVMAEQGFRFEPSELVEAAGIAGLSFVMWFLVAKATVFVAKKMGTESRAPILLVMVWVIPVAILLKATWASKLFVVPLIHTFRHPMVWMTSFDQIQAGLTQLVEPKGIFLVGAFFLGAAAWRFIKTPLLGWPLQECVLGAYAVLISVRGMMGNASYTAVFFNVPLFLIFIILLVRVVQRAARALEAQRGRLLVNCLAGAQALFIFVLMFPDPQRLPAPLKTNIGELYTRGDVAALFPQIVSFMKAHTINGRDILILPEAPALYVFAGMQAPSRWYVLTPGLLAPEHEQEFVDEVRASGVRFVLISNRTANEYGVAPFGIGFNQPVYRWILKNYVKVGQFGPLDPADADSYAMSVLEKKDILRAGPH